ncbi:hypothetical protein AC1031_009682 [Aphanomyces cochlioides]|nr:hypothetical protein AC1031_009682 [Aphanomyces cochlioides]
MAKVSVARPHKASVRFSRWSVAFNLLAAVNLASTPFMAYLTEPLPGRAASTRFPPWTSFQGYTYTMLVFFETLYNNSMPSNVVCKQDRATNTFAMRYILDLQPAIHPDDVQDFLLRLPGSGFYGAGVVTYMTSFLTSNASSRNTLKPWRICEHGYVVGVHIADLCFWMHQVDSLDETLPRYSVWAAVYMQETPELCWFKLALRSLLTFHILYVLWTRYYCHYRVLVRNLRCIGLDPAFVHYQIVVGDPGYAILTDPIVSLAMFVDIWSAGSYMIIAAMRMSQFHDIWAYALSCMYLSRTVWFAYLCMRGVSSLVKWRRWEAWFAPVDPTILAICAYLYGGPMTSLLFMTPVASIFRQTWDVCLTPSLTNEAIEGILGTRVEIDHPMPNT